MMKSSQQRPTPRNPDNGIASKDLKVVITSVLKDIKGNMLTVSEKIGNLSREIMNILGLKIIISNKKFTG